MIELTDLLKHYNVKTSAKSTLKDKALANACDYVYFTKLPNGDIKRLWYIYDKNTKTHVKANLHDNTKQFSITNYQALVEYANYKNGKLYTNAIVNDKLNYQAR